MIALKDSVREELAQSFSINPKELTYLAGGKEDNDGIVYTFVKDNKKFAFKISIAKNNKDIEYLKQKLEFAKFLGEQSVAVAYPKEDKDGNVFKTLCEDMHIFVASVTDFVEGKYPSEKELTEDLLVKWGKLTGKMHKASKKYPVWKSLNGSKYAFDYEEEMDSFYHSCRNEIVKKYWLSLKGELSQLEITRQDYGFTHNDNHQRNILVNEGNIILLDFDCANCNFFMQDIFLPIQGSLFEKFGGINRPINDMDGVKRFFSSFLSGYETENHIEDKWLQRAELFLNYRRLLLYTVMQGWMESDKKVGDSFLEMIENPCGFSII